MNCEIIHTIADHYGWEHQCIKAIEECSELQKELSHYALHEKQNITALIDEIADVEIMLAQLKYLRGIEYSVQERKAYKIARQIKRISKEIHSA